MADITLMTSTFCLHPYVLTLDLMSRPYDLAIVRMPSHSPSCLHPHVHALMPSPSRSRPPPYVLSLMLSSLYSCPHDTPVMFNLVSSSLVLTATSECGTCQTCRTCKVPSCPRPYDLSLTLSPFLPYPFPWALVLMLLPSCPRPYALILILSPSSSCILYLAFVFSLSCPRP